MIDDMKELDNVLDSLKDEMISTVQEWVRVPSVANDDVQPGAPFGPVVRQMLDQAMEDADKLGFKTEIFDDGRHQFLNLIFLVI